MDVEIYAFNQFAVVVDDDEGRELRIKVADESDGHEYVACDMSGAAIDAILSEIIRLRRELARQRQSYRDLLAGH